MDFPRIWSRLKFFCIENIIAEQAIPRKKVRNSSKEIYIVIREKEVDIIYFILPNR